MALRGSGMPQPDRRDLSIGQRIAAHRRRLGLTQDGLAMRLHRSKSWVTKIERGERPLDSVRTLLEVARALGVEVRELTGQPWFPEPGDPDLSWVAANQSADAAEQVGDPALSGASAWRVCHAVLRVDDVDEVYTVATGAARELEPALDEPSGELLSVYGGLHLVGAIASARAGDRPAAQHLLDRARTTAARLGADRNDYWMTFGPTNVAMHDVAVLIESGDPKGAIRHGATVDPSGLASLERQSTHHVQLAHAYTLQRKDSEAVRELLVAERLNPEGVRYNMLAHDFVRGMLRRERRRVTPWAAWPGAPPEPARLVKQSE